jgi:hypothetical protein
MADIHSVGPPKRAAVVGRNLRQPSRAAALGRKAVRRRSCKCGQAVGAGRAARLNDGWGYARLCQRVPTQERSCFFCRFERRDPCRRRGNSDALLVDGRQAGRAPRDPDHFKRKDLALFYQNCSLQISVDVKIRPTIAKVVDASFLARGWRSGGRRPPTDAMANSGNHRRGSLQP